MAIFFFPLVSFINVSWMGKVSTEEASSGQGQSGSVTRLCLSLL